MQVHLNDCQKRTVQSITGVLFQDSQFEHKCYQETSLPLKELVFAHSCSSHWSYKSLGGKKSSLLTQKDTVTTASKTWHLPCITAIYGRTVPHAWFKISPGKRAMDHGKRYKARESAEVWMWDLRTNTVKCLSHEIIEEKIHTEKNFTLFKQGTTDWRWREVFSL